MRRVAPYAAKVSIRDKSTGQVTEHWSVDAREYVTVRPEQYEYALPGPGAPIAAPAPDTAPVAPPTVDYAEALEDKGYLDIQALARRAGLPNVNLKKAVLIAALLPHLEAGSLSLVTPSEVLGIALPPAP